MGVYKNKLSYSNIKIEKDRQSNDESLSLSKGKRKKI
jgi:hypothetical protein